MTEQPKSIRVQSGVLLFGVALAVAVAAIGWRALGDDSPVEPEAAVASDSIEALEQRAQEAGDNASPWQQLAFARFDRGEFAAAADAYREAVARAADQAVLWSALGESLVMASQADPLPAEALAAFRKALALDPKDPRARYFLAVKRDLDGDHQGAIDDWLKLLGDTPPGAPWEQDLARTIEQVGKINGIATAARLEQVQAGRQTTLADAAAVPGLSAGSAIPGPTTEQLQAAGGIPPGEQRQMAEGMVARLESRLKSDPANLEGWVMLMRSRQTLGQGDLARKALADAIAANPTSADRLRKEAEVLGLR
ncbi:tetratricopeptide repeat protein [Erythrobacter mangrovi]|uniref:Tetratricopeptide repeat protein n=1 Tax=Erythrobacter mangrovi TaxID=2739433 RepID=A0A7D4BHE7_9SPHN|nr:tetratricopeptide repeat protein [Erythrobacter mangrovi]QKG72142.1 tetratricopeptide repeat protein [Erythrobacter mangrovi]